MPGPEPLTGALFFQGGLPVDIRGHDRNGLLIDCRRVPFLDHAEIWLSFLIAFAAFPALLAQKIRGGRHRIGQIVQIHAPVARGIDPVFKGIARQELGMAQLAMFGAKCCAGDRA